MKSTITVIGNVASGKSTLISILAKLLKAKTIDADSLFQEKDPFAKPFLADKKRWALSNELWLTYERVKIMRENLNLSNKSLTMIDSGLLMSWVFTRSHYLVGILNENEWQLYSSFYEELTRNLLVDTSVIRLKYSMDTLMKRLHKRARKFELEFYTREYLGQIELGLDALEQGLKKQKVQILTINEAEIADFEENAHEARQIAQLIKQSIQKRTNQTKKKRE